MSPPRILTFALALAVLPLWVDLGRSAPTPGARPFQGRVTAEITNVEPVPPDDLLVSLSGEGRATHLGRHRRTESILLDELGGLNGTLIMEAANGDQLFAEVHGAFTSSSTVAGTYLLVGGTGRFQQASGGAQFEGSTLDGLHFEILFEGSITY